MRAERRPAVVAYRMTSELAARFAQQHADSIAATDLAAYASHLPQDSGAVLVAGTHAGRLLLELVELGYHAHGVESSAAELAHAQAALHASGCGAPLFRQDLASLNLAFRYAGMLIGARIWQNLRRRSLQSALTHAKAHLVEPGVLLLELEVPAEAEHPPGAPLVEIERVKLDDHSIITRRCERSVDAQAHRVDVAERYELRSGAAVTAREDARLAIHWYDESEAQVMMIEAGFANVTIEALACSAGDMSARRFLAIGTLT